MSYTCRQEIIVIEDSETCNRAFEDYILKPALQFIGLDCEWNTNRPVSLLQIATPTIVLLVRVCKLNFTLPENAKLVLEDPTIYKVGVNIENDSDKLGEDCFCKIKSWVDLRHVAIRSKSWAKCIVEQVENLEFTLQYYDQVDQNSESAKQANVKRLCWCPKMGLESLIADCMVRTLPKNTSARWSDNWESNVLQSNQKTYAANDATASLDIFVALVYSSVSGKELPVDETFDVAVIVDKYLNDLENACKGLLDATFMQTKEDMNRIYGAIEATAPDLDIKAYYTKPQSTKSKKEKNERKEFYKKKARESATQKPASPKNTFPAQPTPVKPIPVKMHTESEHLPTAEESDLNPDLDSSRGSHTIREITQALAHTKLNSKTLTENFLTMQSDKTSSDDIESINFLHFPILFYFKHITDKKASLIPGYSYGRGSIPPANYRRLRTVDSDTQTEFPFKETDFKRVFPSYVKSGLISESERNSSANTDCSLIFRPQPVNKPLYRRESPLPNSTTDDEQCSVSSCTSSNYQSSVSKNSKSKGRGRGRGMAASSIGSSRNMDSDGDINLKKGRGRGRGAIVSETRAPKSDAGADFEPEKVAFDSYDIRYQDADEGGNRPNALNLDDRSRRPTESSVSSAATIRQPSVVSETNPQPELTTPTNSFVNAQQKSTFEDEFFDTRSTYSTFSIQDLMADNVLDQHPAPDTRNSFNDRGYSAGSRGTYSNATGNRGSYSNAAGNRGSYSNAAGNRGVYSNAAGNRGGYNNAARQGNISGNVSSSARQSNPYANKPSSRPNHINQNYEYKTDVFRQAVERGANSLHVGTGTGERPQKEVVAFDWNKFREETGIPTASESSPNNTAQIVDLEFSDDSDLD
ncbi:uncharacterized protein LOC134826103 isoform X2 [Bolinopsis microptera]|uniref:uncharacterized protein LOC134826103 isoform X2 n=1 Tax=Bolinopsis microptera TaxID=2820187 RepID=UPI00307AC034